MSVKKIVGWCLTLFLSSVLIIALTYWGINRYLSQPLAVNKAELITLLPGQGVHQLAKTLQQHQWLTHSKWLPWVVKFKPELAQLKQGTYLIEPETTVLALLELLRSGKEHQFTLQFTEGTTFKEWQVLLSKAPFLVNDLAGLTAFEVARLFAIEQSNPEGWFFPDTYAYVANTTASALLKRAHQKMKTVLQHHWLERQANLPLKTPYDALILASIIEKETGQQEEQPLIAAVFINRLRKNMRLQTDPTVIYGLGERYQGDIKRVHLKEKNAYNTYQIKGLPLTPIAMPGESAIKAALHPAPSDFLYFVSRGDGWHHFSKTIAEHNRAVQKYIFKKN
jgi:UPF0755 protein